jgi:protein-tyrosine phosphatase
MKNTIPYRTTGRLQRGLRRKFGKKEHKKKMSELEQQTDRKVESKYAGKKECHPKGNVRIFDSDSPPYTLHAGGRTRGAIPYVGSLVLDFSGCQPVSPVSVYGSLGVTRTRSYLNYTLIQVDWEDFRTPSVGEMFWRALCDDILEEAARKQETNERLHVVVMCVGGHGRTGTALAILGCLLGFIPEDMDPVTWVRKHYCEEAVESHAQLDYIERITGRKVEEHPASSVYLQSGYAGGYGDDYGYWQQWEDVDDDYDRWERWWEKCGD